MTKNRYIGIYRWTFNPCKGGFAPGNQHPQWSKVRGFVEPITKHTIQAVVASLIIIALYIVVGIGFAEVVRQNSYDTHMLAAELLGESGSEFIKARKPHEEMLQKYAEQFPDRDVVWFKSKKLSSLLSEELNDASANSHELVNKLEKEPTMENALAACIANRKAVLLLFPARLGYTYQEETDVETGKVLVSVICPKKDQAVEDRNERITFWTVMKWGVPILLSTAVAFYIYWLTSLARPVWEMKVKIEQLHKENAGLKMENEVLLQKLSEVTERTIKNEVEIENLRGGIAQLENLAEKRT